VTAAAPGQPDQPDLPEIPDDVEVPDDLSALEGSADPDLAALITQVADAEALAAACSLAGIEIDAVPTPVGALAILRDRSDGVPQRAAASVSQVVKGVPLILVTRHGEQLACFRYLDGAEEGKLPPGLVLGGAPEALEDLLTGHLTLADLPGVIPSEGISRLKAIRMLSAVSRKARKKK
jgi:hypothetical protein